MRLAWVVARERVCGSSGLFQIMQTGDDGACHADAEL